MPTPAQPTPSCGFKSGKIILQQPVERAQFSKLLETGKTDLLEKFISNRTRRAFKAYLAWNAEEGKVTFEFEQRESKYPARKGAPAAGKTAAKTAARTTARSAAKKATPAKAAKAPKAAKPRTGGLVPSAALAAVIGAEPVARTEAVKKLWDYIKAQGLQDPKDKRSIVADAKLLPVFGKDRVSMFEIAGLLGAHLG